MILCFGIIRSFAQEEEDTVSYVNYEIPGSEYFYSYRTEYAEEEPDLDDYLIFEPKLYPIGWSDKGDFAYILEPPDVRCGCYYLEMYVQAFNEEDPKLLFYEANEELTEEQLTSREFEGPERFYEQMSAYQGIEAKEASFELDSAGNYSCANLRCVWFKVYNDIAQSLQSYEIEQELSEYNNLEIEKEDETRFNEIDIDTVEGSQQVNIKLLFETGDTIQYSFTPKNDLINAAYHGYYVSHRDQRQIMVLIELFETGLREEEAISDFKFIPVKLTPNPEVPLVQLPRPKFEYDLAYDSEEPIRRVWLTEDVTDRATFEDENDWFMEYGRKIMGKAYTSSVTYEQIDRNYFSTDFTKVLEHKDQLYHLSLGIRDGSTRHLIYGSKNENDVVLKHRFLVSYNSYQDSVMHWYDFKNFTYYPKEDKDEYLIHQDIRWVQQEDSILYVSTSHRSHSSLTDGKNGLITAINTKTDKVLWQSASQTSNTFNFLLLGDVIITGYGYGDEKSQLFVVNRYTGETIDKVELQSRPMWLVQDGDYLHVNAEDSNYEFRLMSTFFSSH